jgi:hypothetical protein
LNHYASSDFWAAYRSLPVEIRELADRNFDLLKSDPQHPSLHFKTLGAYRSVRIGLRYRALGVEVPDGVSWFWIGTHAEYDQLVG